MNSLKLNVALAAPVLTYASTATTGGTLTAATTYFYRISPIMAVGPGGPQPGAATGSTGQFEGLAVAQGAGQLTGAGNTNTVTITWTAVPGATGYNVYGRLTGAPFLMTTTGSGTLTYTDTGAQALGTQTVLGASTALAGNSFLPGPNVGAYSSASAAGTVSSPFVAGRTVSCINMTGGTITITGSDDGITAFSGTKIVNAAGTAVGVVTTLQVVDLVLPNFAVASAAGLFVLGSG